MIPATAVDGQAQKQKQNWGIRAFHKVRGLFTSDISGEINNSEISSGDVEIHTWNGPNDPENPFNWSKKYKWVLTVTVCFISILTGLPAGTYGSGNDWMAEKFHVQNSPFPSVYWATTSWNMGAAFWPLIFIPLTESSGRMPGYFVAYIILIISLFPSAFAPNFATLVVTRIFGGGASSVSINIVGGSIPSVCHGDKARSLPMSLFGFTSVVGIALGPFISSAIIRSTRTILGAGYPTPDPMQSSRVAPLKPAKKQAILSTPKPRSTPLSTLRLLQISFKRPTKMLLTETVVTFFSLWISFVWGNLCLFFSSVVQTFGGKYGWDTLATGPVQLAISVGAVIGTVFNPVQECLYLCSSSRNKQKPGKPVPEVRLYTSIPGSLLFAAAAACVGIYSIYMAVVNYLNEAYERYAASALSAASLGRNSFGAFLPLACPQLFSNLGFGWAGTLLGFIGVALSVIPVVLVPKGPAIRRSSPFMRESMWDTDTEDSETGDGLDVKEGDLADAVWIV
ncbi:major facilitator superfamily domain-containing protein [Aspergillus spinulosporus]